MSINYNGTIKSLRDIVWGMVTDPLSQIEQITLLIFIKLLSERHNELERLKAKKLIFTGEYASYHFDFLSRLSGYELVDTTRKAVESLYKNPNIDESIRRLYERSYLQVNDPRVLSLLINEINKIDIAHIDMGDFYEHLLAVLGTQKEAGQFRTPRHLIKFIVDIIDPQIGERVLDPACGTAGFLTAAYTYIRDANTSQEARKTDSYLDKLNFDKKTFLLNKTIFGFDIDPKMIKFAISNLYLHNIKNPNISQHNTLTSNDSWEEKYDVILTNPPFSTPKGGVRPTDRFTLDSKRTEVLFVEYVIEHLTLNGRAGVIVPEGIIFQSGKAYKELRKWLVENKYLYAVVSLPSGVFNPYSGVKTSILFIDRERTQKSDKILFCKVDNDGFDLGAQRKPIDKNDLPEVLEVIKEYKKDSDRLIDSKHAYSVTKDKIIQSGDYNLSGDRYKETISFTNQKWTMVELGEVVVEMKDGGTPSRSKPEYFGGDINWCVVKDIVSEIYETKEKLTQLGLDNSSAKVWPIDSIIISLGATIGNVGIVKVPTATKQGISGIVVNKEKILSKYLFYILVDKKEFIQSLATGVSIKEIRPARLQKTLRIPLPPLSVQQQIVDELDGYQKIIVGAKQIVDNYEPQIKIDQELKKTKLGDKVKLISGQHIDSNDYSKTKIGTPYITGPADFGEYYPIITKWTDKPKILAKKNDVLITVKGSGIGSLNILDIDSVCISRQIMAIRTVEIEMMYLFFFLYSKYEYFQKKGTGAAIPGLTRSDLLDLLIPLPSLKVQKQIVARIEEEQKLVEANKKLIQLFEQKIKDKIEEIYK